MRTLIHSSSALLKIPLFLAAFLLVRGVPALAYARLLSRPRIAVAGLLQATTLTILIVTVELGERLGKMAASTGIAMLTAGLLSVVLFPPAALSLLRRTSTTPAQYRQFG